MLNYVLLINECLIKVMQLSYAEVILEFEVLVVILLQNMHRIDRILYSLGMLQLEFFHQNIC